MKKLILSLTVILWLALPVHLRGQQHFYTQVQAVVEGKSGNPYSDGSWQVNLDTSNVPAGTAVTFQRSNSFQASYSGQMDANGNFSVTLPDNDVIVPVGGTKWKFSFCANYSGPSGPCFSLSLTITGSSMDITSQVQAAAAALYPIDIGAVNSSLVPSTSNTYSLGSSSYFWSGLYGELLDVPGGSTLAGGGTLSGTFSGSPIFSGNLAFSDSPTIVGNGTSGLAAFDLIGKELFDVKNYGAAGDGTTNDTTAVNATVSAACAASPIGGTIYFPPGTYVLDPLTDLSTCLNSAGNSGTVSLRLIGAGVSATVLEANSAGIMIAKTVSGNVRFGLDIENMTLDGNSQSGETGIKAYAVNQFVLRNLKFQNFDTAPISINAATVGEMDNVLVVDPVGSSANGIVIGPTSPGPSTQITMTNVFVDGYANGLYVPATGGLFGRLTLIDCAFNSQTANGLDIQGGSQLVIIGADVEETVGAANGLNLGDTTESASALVAHVSIVGGYFQTSGAGKYAIDLDKVSNVDFSGGTKVDANGINLTSNVRLISGSVYTASVSGAKPSANTGRYRYSTDGATWVYVNGPSAGTITLSSGSGSHSFSNVSYASAPVCTVHDDTTQANTVATTVTATSISLSGTGSDVISWTCNPAVN